MFCERPAATVVVSLAFVGSFLVACGDTSPTSTETSTSPAAAASNGSGHSSASPSGNRIPAVTAFGATLDVWKAHHVEDKNPKLNSGCCWNPDPKLDLGPGGGTQDDYVSLSTDDNIVDHYDMLFNYRGTTIDQARQAAMRELPPDAVVAFFVHGTKCAVLEVTSQTLVPILRDPKIGVSNGSVDFQFQSANADLTGFVYDPSNVEEAQVTIGLGDPVTQESQCS
jgi:hypothetical protein